MEKTEPSSSLLGEEGGGWGVSGNRYSRWCCCCSAATIILIPPEMRKKDGWERLREEITEQLAHERGRERCGEE